MSLTLQPAIKVIGGVSLFLLMIMLVEIIYVSVSMSSSEQAVITPRSQANELLSSTEQTVQNNQYDIIAKKPLFIEGREARPEETNTGTVKVIEPVKNKPFKIQLVGVGLMGNDQLVLIIDNKGKYHRLHVDDKLYGWRVKSITKKSVLFAQQGKSKVFELENKRAPFNGKQPRQLPKQPSKKLIELISQ